MKMASLHRWFGRFDSSLANSVCQSCTCFVWKSNSVVNIEDRVASYYFPTGVLISGFVFLDDGILRFCYQVELVVVRLL